MSPQGISREQIQSFQEAFKRDPRNLLARNAVTKSPIQSVALNREVVVGANHTFSHVVKATTRRCRSRAAAAGCSPASTCLRVEAMKRLKVEQFEFSQNYLMFYDKLEKANFFLETVIQTADEPTDGRLIAVPAPGPASRTAASGTCSPTWCASTAWCPRASCPRASRAARR